MINLRKETKAKVVRLLEARSESVFQRVEFATLCSSALLIHCCFARRTLAASRDANDMAVILLHNMKTIEGHAI